MALIPCLALAAMLSTVTRCDAGKPSCGPLIEKSVGDDVEIGTCSSGGITEAYWKYGKHKKTQMRVDTDDSQFKGRVHVRNSTFNLLLSGLTLQDFGVFGFFSSTGSTQHKTIFFTLRVYEAITDVAVWEINSTQSRSESCVTWLQCAASRSDSGAERGNYTWTVGNQTYAGARLKYVSREADETATCTVSNPVSRGFASVQPCSNGTYPTDGSIGQDKSFTQLWVYVLSGLGVGLLTLVLVWLLLRRSRRTKAAPDAEEALYADLENVPVKDATSNDDELTLGPLYETVRDSGGGLRPQAQKATSNDDELTLGSLYETVRDSGGGLRPQAQKSDVHTIYYTVQQSCVIDPSS
ncbi:hypothetical protein NHX12_014263 [Muraenolepis orangiensis]|uniref:Ig-like domain-containing protein n=1 Tax=Muraenolepis orangiensis TaxID=630683 RepID=A0A9Q0DB14_9TELE|nr:hypothetical protein NHX12_014263 [Muraenolepis orangiensis]